MKSSLDLSTLESHLWEAANILRGPVDAADFKTYIFPLLFFKRISDVYDEERVQVEAEYGEGVDFAEFHRFQIPEGCHWRDVRAHTTNVGQALQNALRGIEQANLFCSTGLAACILVFRMRKPPERQGRVLVIDASELYERGRNQNTLESEHVEQILAWYQAYEDVEGAAQVVGLDQIAENDWNLNIPRYVEPMIEEETLTVAEATRNLKQALDEAYAAEDHLERLLTEAGLMWVRTGGKSYVVSC